jgi:hypothetical protein
MAKKFQAPIAKLRRMLVLGLYCGLILSMAKTMDGVELRNSWEILSRLMASPSPS